MWPYYGSLLPVPGDGRYDWTGFYGGDDLPRADNPPQGFIATANQLNLAVVAARSHCPCFRQLGH